VCKRGIKRGFTKTALELRRAEHFCRKDSRASSRGPKKQREAHKGTQAQWAQSRAVSREKTGRVLER